MKVVHILSLLWASVAYGNRVRAIETIKTSSGPVEGHEASVEKNVSAYLGIPYAKPPLGKLRFMPPVKYKGKDKINGTSIGFGCQANTPFSARGNDLNNYNLEAAKLTAQGVSSISIIEQVWNVSLSEDCLTLNVWVPSGGDEKKAVVVFIHGGSYTSGSSQIAVYDGQHLANKNGIIVVTINYRVDILGFPGGAGLKNSNPGWLDQRMAIEWVRDNIAAFGGDTSKITLMGQSAGGASVDHYAYAHAKDPIVSGLIMESGVAGFGKPLPKDNVKNILTVADKLGCVTKDVSPKKVLRCLQKQDVKALLKVVQDGWAASPFQPSVDNITGFPDYPARSKAGNFAQLPVLTGSNDNEAGTYVVVYALMNITMTKAQGDAKTNNTFGCPVGARANVSVSHSLPVWRYRYFGDFPNTRLYEGASGAWHFAEIQFVWDTLPTGEGIPPDTPEEISIRDYIQGAWGAFIKNPKEGLLTYGGGWPIYSPTEETLVRLAYNNVTGTNLATPGQYDTCAVWYPADKVDPALEDKGKTAGLRSYASSAKQWVMDL